MQAAGKAAAVTDQDYIQDGLLHCSLCHSPKQVRVRLLGRDTIQYCMCRCKAEELRQNREREQMEKHKETVANLRREGFYDKALEYATFDNDDGSAPENMAVAKRYVENFERFYHDGKGILFWGACGTGKTYLASCIANAVIDMGKSAVVTSFPRLTAQMQSWDNKADVMYSLSECCLLVIDDLGVERNTEYMLETVYTIIDERYRSGKPMIVTTNLSLGDIKNPSVTAQKRIYDRILEMCVPYEVKGKNRRYTKVAQSYREYQEILGLEEHHDGR